MIDRRACCHDGPIAGGTHSERQVEVFRIGEHVRIEGVARILDELAAGDDRYTVEERRLHHGHVTGDAAVMDVAERREVGGIGSAER